MGLSIGAFKANFTAELHATYGDHRAPPKETAKGESHVLTALDAVFTDKRVVTVDTTNFAELFSLFKVKVAALAKPPTDKASVLIHMSGTISGTMFRCATEAFERTKPK